MASTFPQWLQSVLQEMLEDHPGWPGIQLTVSSSLHGLNCTKSVWSRNSKFAKEPELLDTTPWRIASITKTFTAISMLKLAELQKLDLHASALQYLPSWAGDQIKQSQGPDNAAQITIWHLLHHTSGLGDFASDPRWAQELFNDPQKTWTQKSVIEWSTVNSKPVGYPREKYHYSDTGYTLLGLILEQLTGQGLAEAVRKLTKLDELNMPSTWWELLEKKPQTALPRAGQWYKDIDTTHFNPTFDLFGAGGLISNSKDLNQFGKAMLEKRVLNDESMKTLCTLDDSGIYACGVVKYSLAGYETWGHTGFWGTWLYWVPSLDLVISGANNKARDGSFDADKFVKILVQAGYVRS